MKALAIKTFLTLVGIGLVIILVVAGYGFYWYNSNTQPVSQEAQDIEIVIEKGESYASVAQKLEDSGIIKNAFALRLWTKLSGEEVTVQAGAHTLSPHMTFKEITHELLVGIEDVKLLIKEGLRVEEIAELFATNFDSTFNKQEFLALAKPKEGQLFPDTYIFQKSTSAQTAFSKLNQEFETKYASLAGPTDPQLKKETLILASILEREGKSDTDRPVIAGILRNRLDKQTETAGFLNVDATLQYAVNEKTKKTATWWPVPTAEDKEVESLFNTYKYKGLPPSPICNPGLSALKAAINPQENDYLYYIHDKTGKAYYGRNFDEHDANIGKYLL